MSDFHIAREWLEVSRNTAFIYPAAGSDYAEALSIFQDFVDVFWFCDISYPRGLELPALCASNADLRLIETSTAGELMATMELRKAQSNRSYRFLEPSRLVETYLRTDGRRLTVIRRRGFGQIG
jgi:hypothetical protein